MREELTIPAVHELRELRIALARASLSALDARASRTERARLASFRTIVVLLRVLEEFKRRVEAGEPCSLSAVDHTPAPGRYTLEFTIQAAPEERPHP
ncbi:Hypothetical protein A7982_07952 [Minicystis rosea]|nr:Hypothetical protein A7982_07952 [Minicystis rosea]